MPMQQPSYRGTDVCSPWPQFSLEDFQRGNHYHVRQGLELDGADAYVVGLYYAD